MKTEISIFSKADISYTKGNFEKNTWNDKSFLSINTFINSFHERKFRRGLQVAELFFFNENGSIYISEGGSFKYISSK